MSIVLIGYNININEIKQYQCQIWSFILMMPPVTTPPRSLCQCQNISIPIVRYLPLLSMSISRATGVFGVGDGVSWATSTPTTGGRGVAAKQHNVAAVRRRAAYHLCNAYGNNDVRGASRASGLEWATRDVSIQAPTYYISASSLLKNDVRA